MQFTLEIGKTRAFDEALADGDIVHIRSDSVLLQNDPQVYADNTSINILSGNGDYLVHISLRRHIRTIVFNSRYAHGGWGPEERVPFAAFFQEGVATNLSICNRADSFEISINGAHCHTFKKRIILPAKSLAYMKLDDMTTSIFGSIVTVLKEASPPPTYESAYFQLTPADVEKESEDEAFDIVIIGSGIGGGVLACSLLAKNQKVMQSNFDSTSTPAPIDRRWRVPIYESEPPSPPKPLRILVIERGKLVFHTHCLNGPRPSISGTTSQGNDLFFKKFKQQWDMDEVTREHWDGGGVYCLGGRGAVWGLFSPR